MTKQFIKIGLISISDRASAGIYADAGIPSLQEWLNKTVINPIEYATRLIADDQIEIEQTLIDLSDYEGCHLVLTTGGTGPALRDVTPEATLNIGDKEMRGFGEQMRQISLNFVPTAILSRQVAVIRKQCLIINLPGQPKAIAQILEGLKDDTGRQIVHGVFAAVPYCLDLLSTDQNPMPYIETHENIVKSFRPNNAVKPYKPS